MYEGRVIDMRKNKTEMVADKKKGNLPFYLVTFAGNKEKGVEPYSQVLTSYELRQELKKDSKVVASLSLLNGGN